MASGRHVDLLGASAAWPSLGEDGAGGNERDLTPGQLRKLSLQLAEKRTALAESGMWNELLRTLRFTPRETG